MPLPTPGSADAIEAMFSAIAPRYDFLNRLLSAGRDVAWRRAAIRATGLPHGGRLLDACTGTADMALEAIRQHPGCRVVGVDFSGPMLARAAVKVAAAGLQDRIVLQRASAESLPFAAASFDAACVAFGLRNLIDRPRGLAEMSRVLRPGGRAVVLEFGTPRTPGVAALYRWYFRRVLPAVGRLLSGHPSAYAYLPASVVEFPPPDGVAAWMHTAGLHAVTWRTMTCGIVAIHVGIK